MIDKAKNLPADEVFLDLEDAVAPDAKSAARTTVAAALAEPGWGAQLRGVRINDWTTPWTHGDIIEVVAGAGAALAWALLLGGALGALAWRAPAGMGMGDAKLAAVLGAALGPGAVLALLVACGCALAAGAAAAAAAGLGAGRAAAGAVRHAAVPFAPLLAVGACVAWGGG